MLQLVWDLWVCRRAGGCASPSEDTRTFVPDGPYLLEGLLEWL